MWFPCALYNLSLVQASGLEHLIKDDISDTGKNKFDVVRIGGRSQMWINWPFFQIDLTLAQKSIDYEVGGFRHIVFTLKLGKIVWLPDYYYYLILEIILKKGGKTLKLGFFHFIPLFDGIFGHFIHKFSRLILQWEAKLL